ncbi:hypothetical protein GT034_16750 [Streptomyces sp. SID2563]|uniref:hypothetical protein n=1 Tax=Streptomyces sp. SID2563 TaxID=2690255 RepID=UPI00136E0317|nr:hypothetical protein [Streptomyces sp. SID2563]MYW09988.1 hypothetical protein [Streptomyces sp. SID2563]
MPKKRKKSRKPTRATPPPAVLQAKRSLPAEAHDWDDDDSDWDDDEDFPMSDFRAQFASPADAVAGTRAGKPWEWVGCVDGSRMRHRILVRDDGAAVVEQAVFLGTVQEGAILCAWHEAGPDSRPLLEKNILNALDSLHEAVRPHLEAEIREVRGEDYTAVVPQAFMESPEPYGAGVPLFGWRILHPVTPDSTWDDTLDVALWSTSIAVGGWAGSYDHIDEVRADGFTALLRRHNVPAHRCAECKKPITSRHPRWPGIWTTPTDEGGGPACAGTGSGPYPPEPRIGWYTDSEFGEPHRPDS